MNERKTQKALKKFCENQYWKEYYETAPTGACKRYIELEFYYSDYWGQIPDYDELKKESDSLEEEFVKADWAHLYKYCANNSKKFIIKIKWKSTRKKKNNIITSVSEFPYRGADCRRTRLCIKQKSGSSSFLLKIR